MTLEIAIACAGLAIALITPFVSQWLTLHASTKDDYRRLIGNIVITVGLTYSMGMLLYLLGNDEPITKSYLFKLTLHIITLVLYLIMLMIASQSKIMARVMDGTTQSNELQKQLTGHVSELTNLQSLHIEATRSLSETVSSLTGQSETHLDALDETLAERTRNRLPE